MFNLPASKFVRLVMMVLIFAVAFVLVASVNASSDLENVEKSRGYKFVAKGVLSGRVTDAETGAPVTDAYVDLVNTRGTKTDANGFYSFEGIFEKGGNYQIRVTSKKYVGIYGHKKMPEINLRKGEETVNHFELKKACMIEVRVVDEEGRGVEKARLVVTSPGSDNRREIMGTNSYDYKTDANGLALLGGIPVAESEYLITASHSSKDAKDHKWYYDYAPGHLIIKLDDPDVVEQGKIVLKKGVTVRGYAEYSDGVPASDTEIIAYPEWWYNNYLSLEKAMVDANGHFMLKHVSSGIHDLSVHIGNRDGSARGFSVSRNRSLPLPEGELLVLKIPEKSPGSFVSISGTVSYVGEGKAGHISVRAYLPGYRHLEINLKRNWSTGENDPNFIIDKLEPGKYELTFSGNGIETKVLKDIEAPSEGLEVDLVLIESTKPIVGGLVIDGLTGDPVEKFKARLKKLRGFTNRGRMQPDRWIEFHNEKGSFQLEAVGKGIFCVEVSTAGFSRSRSEEISTDANEPLVVKLTKGGSIKGRVVDESGNPINAAKVIPLSLAGGSNPWEKDVFKSEAGAVETVDGNFVLENLTAGTETLKVVHPDYPYLIVDDIGVVEGELTDGVEIVLRKGCSIEGYVYDHEGKPQAKEVLNFYESNDSSSGIERSNGVLSKVVTDANGFYKVTGLPEKICYVQRNEIWEVLGVASRAIIPKIEKTTKLDFGGASIIRGRLVINGEAVSNRRVQIGSSQSPRSESFMCFAMTDGEGYFEFRGAIAGKYALYYKSIKERSQWNKAMVIDVGDDDIDLGDVPGEMSRLEVTIVQDDPQEDHKIRSVRLNRGDEPSGWGNPAGNLEKPSEPLGPYVLDNILPGVYTFVAVREDNMTIRERIEVDKGVHKVTVQIPKSTASISGKFTGGFPLVIWRKDKKFVFYIQQNTEGAYEIENLPAGRYLAGGNMLIEKHLLAEFELSEGEHEIMDFDTHAWQEELKSKSTSGILFVNVALDNGVPVEDADVWLEKGGEVVRPLGSSALLAYFMTEVGDYILHVTYPGCKQSSVAVTIEKYGSANQRKPVIIRLEREL